MRLLKWLEDVLWPRGLGCICCDDLCRGRLLCDTCQKALDAMKLPYDDAAEDIRSIYRYEGVARQLVILLKDHCAADAGTVLSKAMADAINSMKLPENTVLTWVTMPDIRRKKRGIDHGRTLCEAVSSLTGMPVRQLLVRSKNGHTQRGLNREARLKNIADSIRCEGSIDSTVVLIDDVLTTGATVSVCAEALRKAGATKVIAVTATKVVLSKRSSDNKKG